jgi:hypothetical protein
VVPFAKEQSMAKWEYRVCAVQGDGPAQVEDRLNANLKTLGEEGWRFVETIYAPHNHPLLLFKKAARLNVKLGIGKQEKAAP